MWPLIHSLTNWLTELLLSPPPSLPSSQPSILGSRRCGRFVELHGRGQILTDASSFHCHCSASLSFFCFSIIAIICPEWALSERGRFVLAPDTRLFSGSAVFSSSPLVHLPVYTRGKCLSCFWHVVFVLLTGFISLYQVKVCQDNANYHINIMIRIHYS